MTGSQQVSNGGGSNSTIRPNNMQAALSTAAALASVVHSDPYPSVLPSAPISAPIPIVPAQVATPAPAPIAPATKPPIHHHYSYPRAHPPMHQPPMFQTQQQQPKKSLFENMKLRRGKWTAEEEAYADLLIKEFEKGTVEGCENGCTLRSFLSRKLHCAPMRISKKYAGKSIGKHVFLSRSTVSPIVDQKDTTNCKAKLHELEMKFHKSLFQETEAANSLMAYVPQPVSASYPVQVMSTASAPCSGHPGAYVTYPQQQPPVWVMGKSTNDQQHTNNQLHHQTNQLHQTFLSALNQTNSPKPNVTTSIAPAPAPLGAPKPPVHMAPVAQPPPPYPQRQAQIMQVTRHVHKIPAPAASLLPIAPKTHSAYPDPGNMDIPDFLSGFDKVAAERSKKEQQMQTPAPNPPPPVHIQSSEYSPPFTSRSFDDLHQHLGKGLSPRPFDLNNSTGYPEQRTVTADSYAIFAQQSALAVSQHSAYKQEAVAKIPFPTLASSSTPSERPVIATLALTPSVVNAANLRAHSMANSKGSANVVSSGSERNSEWGTEGSESTAVSSTGCQGSDTTSDNHSDNLSNDSDSNSLEGPQKKKIKVQ